MNNPRRTIQLRRANFCSGKKKVTLNLKSNELQEHQLGLWSLCRVRLNSALTIVSYQFGVPRLAAIVVGLWMIDHFHLIVDNWNLGLYRSNPIFKKTTNWLKKHETSENCFLDHYFCIIHQFGLFLVDVYQIELIQTKLIFSNTYMLLRKKIL